MGALAEANALQKESPGWTHARGSANCRRRSEKVGYLDPARTLLNARLAALFQEKGADRSRLDLAKVST